MHRAVDLDDLVGARAGLLMQAVDVLRDDRDQPTGPFEVDEGRVPAVRLRRPRRMVATGPPRASAYVRVGDVVGKRGELLRLGILGPYAVRPAEVRYAAIG